MSWEEPSLLPNNANLMMITTIYYIHTIVRRVGSKGDRRVWDRGVGRERGRGYGEREVRERWVKVEE